MESEKLYKEYSNKICIIYFDNGVDKLAWFDKLSEAQDFQESGNIIVSMVNLKHIKDKNQVRQFLDSLLFDGYEL
jgi:hypothetical protein